MLLACWSIQRSVVREDLQREEAWVITPAPLQDVYRYAFRLDLPGHSLDWFGFSIVFVNDTSALSREFLQKYCLDLCFRIPPTDSGSFSFSELPEYFLKDVAADLDTAALQDFSKTCSDSSVDASLTSNTIPVHVPGSATAADCWRHLGASGLGSATSIQQCPEQGWRCSLRSGSDWGAAVRAFVIFTDIGDLHVDVFLSPLTFINTCAAGLTSSRAAIGHDSKWNGSNARLRH